MAAWGAIGGGGNPSLRPRPSRGRTSSTAVLLCVKQWGRKSRDNASTHILPTATSFHVRRPCLATKTFRGASWPPPHGRWKLREKKGGTVAIHHRRRGRLPLLRIRRHTLGNTLCAATRACVCVWTGDFIVTTHAPGVVAHHLPPAGGTSSQAFPHWHVAGWERRPSSPN